MRCVGIFKETSDVKTFHFMSASKLQEKALFLHKPGQFVALQLIHGGKRFSRTYTVSSPPTRPSTISLTIKRDPRGLVSRFMHDHVKVEDIVPMIGPTGEFNTHDIRPKQKLLLLSGGSGITPVMSALRELYDTVDVKTDVVFLHSARTPQDIIFRNELNWMSSERANFRVVYICEHGSESDMEAGFLDAACLQRQVPDFLERSVMTCGPAPYMEAIVSILNGAGFDMFNYHEESFGNPALRKNPEGAKPGNIHFADPFDPGHTEEVAEHFKRQIEVEPEEDNAEHVVHFLSSGKEISYKPGETLLSIASRAGIAISTNCQMGLCGTCKIKLDSGKVIMEEEEGLTEEDRADNYILTCCGRPKGSVKIHL